MAMGMDYPWHRGRAESTETDHVSMQDASEGIAGPERPSGVQRPLTGGNRWRSLYLLSRATIAQQRVAIGSLQEECTSLYTDLTQAQIVNAGLGKLLGQKEAENAGLRQTLADLTNTPQPGVHHVVISWDPARGDSEEARLEIGRVYVEALAILIAGEERKRLVVERGRMRERLCLHIADQITGHDEDDDGNPQTWQCHYCGRMGSTPRPSPTTTVATSGIVCARSSSTSTPSAGPCWTTVRRWRRDARGDGRDRPLRPLPGAWPAHRGSRLGGWSQSLPRPRARARPQAVPETRRGRARAGALPVLVLRHRERSVLAYPQDPRRRERG